MANTTIDQLSSLTGTGVAAADLFLVYDASANTEKNISSAEMKNMIGNGPLTITTSGVTDALVVTSTDAGATAAPDVVFYRNSASPAASDIIGNIVFRGKNSIAVDKDYAAIYSWITSPTNAAESADISLHTMNTGTIAERVRIRADGNVGIGSGGGANQSLVIGKNMTGGTSVFGILNGGTIQNDVTGVASIFCTGNAIAADTTIATIHHYFANQGTFGVNTSVTAQAGFAASASLVGATTNNGFVANGVPAANVTTGKLVVGFSSNHPIATGGGTSFNFYSGGTAPNFFNGSVGIGTTTPTTPLHVVGDATITSQISGGYALLTTGTVAMALATNRVVKVTPNAAATFTTTVAPAGARATVLILTSGATSYTITFGTGFKTTGTLATGTTAARTFAIEFVSDGTSMIETSRTVAMA